LPLRAYAVVTAKSGRKRDCEFVTINAEYKATMIRHCCFVLGIDCNIHSLSSSYFL